MRSKTINRYGWLALIAMGAAPLSADSLSFVLQPTAPYVSSTTLLPITDPEGSIITSISDSALTISFVSGGSPLLMDVSVTPDSWATWGAPPNTESSTPTVVHSDDPTVTDVLFQFSSVLTTFGIELEPDDTSAAHDITATFLSNGSSIGVLQRSVDGNGGALLFAGTGAVFDSVEVSSDIDFAAAQFRYSLAPPVPEPSSGLLVVAGVAAVAFWLISVAASRRAANKLRATDGKRLGVG
jgi:hypothetical protein